MSVAMSPRTWVREVLFWVHVGVTPVLICAHPDALSVLLKNVHLEFIVFLVKLSVIVSFSNVSIGFLLWSECFAL
jgi:hypothetical protein